MTEAMPHIPCICCKRTMTAIFQMGVADHPGHFLVTCENLECDLWGQTLSVDDYPPGDLESYLAYGRSTRSERAQRKLESQAAAKASRGAS